MRVGSHPVIRREEDTQTDTGEGHVTVETKTRVMQLKPTTTKDCWQLAEAGRGKEQIPVQNLQKESTLMIQVDFGLTASGTMKEQIFYCLNPSNLLYFVTYKS